MPVRIVRLELENFKSYHGAATIGPFLDFTCIVGPNGSGKSNLMDAISFVLGSKAASMRASSLSDFVNRKAKAKGCAVTLVLADNSDATRAQREIALRRSVTGKGAVGTTIDGHTVSESEFATALRKHSLGQRLETFLLFQHEVEAAAQRKPVDLTRLIEVVSGSAEIKRTYDERKRAMETANAALAQAGAEKRGALAEVAQLKLHKQEAERYAQLDHQLTEERRMLALCEMFHIETQLTKNKAALKAAQAEVERLAAVSTEERTKDGKRALADASKAHMERLRDSRKANTTLRERKSMMDRVRASLAHYEAKAERERKELAGAQETGAAREEQVSRLERQVQQQQAALAALEGGWRAEDEREEQAGGGLGALGPAERKEYDALRREADCSTVTERQSLETMRRIRNSTHDALRQLRSKLESDAALRREAEEALAAMSQRVAKARGRAEDHRRAEADTQAQLQAAQAAQLAVKGRLETCTGEVQRLDAKIREMRHVMDDSRHSRQFDEALATLKTMHPGIRGKLHDLCRVKQREKYTAAVTVAMGRHMDAVVVDTTDTAMACVRYLKEQRLTQMSFIPLSAAQGRAVDDALRALGTTCKPVSDVLEYDDAIEPAVRYAVGRTLVCDSMGEAKEVAYGGGERQKVVTTDGTMLLKNGSVQGGLAAIKHRAAKWDESTYAKLKADRDSRIRDSVEQEGEERNRAVEVRNLQQRLEYEAMKRGRSDAEAEEVAGKGKLLEKEARKAVEAAATTEKRVEGVAKHVTKLDSDIDAAADRVLAAERKVFAVFQKRTGIADIADMEYRHTMQARQRAEKRQTLTLAIDKLEKAADAERRRVGLRGADDVQVALLKTEKELRVTKEDFGHITQAIAAATEEQGKALQAVMEAKRRVDELEEQARTRSRRTDDELRRVATARKSVHTRQAACDALRMRRDNLLQRCLMEEVALPTRDAAEDKATTGGRGKRGRAASGGDEESGPSGDEGLVSTTSDGEQDEPRLARIRSTEALSSSLTISGQQGTAATGSSRRAGGGRVMVVFDELTADVRHRIQDPARFGDFKMKTTAVIDQLARDLEDIAPNLKASTRYESSEKKLSSSAADLDNAREKARAAMTVFHRTKEQRAQRFMTAFERINKCVDAVYRELTLGTRAADVSGSAYLGLEDDEEPYLGGTRYHATPPMKRFMAMEQLSGGERTMAALALVFALHAAVPARAPFFVLDEVDAALDVGNVTKLAEYLRRHAGGLDGTQFVVVSLKEQLFHKADSLIGVFKDTHRESSGTLTIDLRKYAD